MNSSKQNISGLLGPYRSAYERMGITPWCDVNLDRILVDAGFSREDSFEVINSYESVFHIDEMMDYGKAARDWRRITRNKLTFDHTAVAWSTLREAVQCLRDNQKTLINHAAVFFYLEDNKGYMYMFDIRDDQAVTQLLLSVP